MKWVQSYYCIYLNGWFKYACIAFAVYTKYGNVFLFSSTEAPEFLLDANMARDHLAMLGTDITLSATIKGVPTPTVSWKKNDGDIPSHITVAVTATGSKVFIPKSVRADSGNYTITAENAAGKKSATVTVLVLSKWNINHHKFWSWLVLDKTICRDWFSLCQHLQTGA